MREAERNGVLTETSQCASRVLMVRPGSFGRNEAAADSNAFMESPEGSPDDIARRARDEFDGLARAVRDAGIEVVIDDEPDLPDSVFPNNWFSYHEPRLGDPVLITYPMATPARRLERRDATIERVARLAGRPVRRIRLEGLEERGEALEGTGSLVLDRVGGVAFACLSSRTTPGALEAWGEATGCRVVAFHATDPSGEAIYHTNVVMSIGARTALLVTESIRDASERDRVLGELEAIGKRRLDLSIAQMSDMCANAIELRSARGGAVWVMSDRAYAAFSSAQLDVLQESARIARAPIPTIERVGGGSARCMIAELGGASL